MRRFIVSMLVSALAAPGFASTIATWTFETSLPATAGPFAAEVGTGSALGSHAGASTYSSPAGNGSSHSFSSNTWAVGDYYQFAVNTVGFPTVFLDFDQTSSSTGPRDFKVQYSTDGSLFTDLPSGGYSPLANASPNPVWNATTSSSLYHLSYNVSVAGKAATAFFRLVNSSTIAENGAAVAAGGTDRVDNVTVSDVPEPASIGLLVLGGLALVRRRA